jgi:glycosyltransferase involved in cell wall biosynthesis
MKPGDSTRRRVLVCAPMPPEYDRESGSRRIYHLIEVFLEAGWDVAFICENAPPGSRHIEHLRQRGVVAHVGFDGRAADLVAVGEFHLALFAFWYLAERYADLVRHLSPSTRIVVESVDLHWLRNARRVLGGADGAPGLLDASFGAQLVGELNAYARADAVLTVSEKEAGLVNDIVGDPLLAHAVPDSDDTPSSQVPFAARRGMLFVGNFRHPPNLDAVAYLCRDILPVLPSSVRRAHPLTIVGNGLDGRVREHAAGLDHVRLVGWVPSLVPYLHAARISVIPLRYGAGTKRKLIQALLARTPSVTTPVGIEGLPVRDGDHVLVADDAHGFAAAVERLLEEAETWTRLASRGRRRVLRLHGPDATRRRLLSVVDDVLARPGKAAAESSAKPGVDESETARTRVREAVARTVPGSASVLVVSKGDPELVRFPDRPARHFPESTDGRYAGYHPRDSRDAVDQLDALPERPDYLVVPEPSLWWLDYYGGFAAHLRQAHEKVWADEHCHIYRLAPGSGPRRASDATDPGLGAGDARAPWRGRASRERV